MARFSCAASTLPRVCVGYALAVLLTRVRTQIWHIRTALVWLVPRARLQLPDRLRCSLLPRQCIRRILNAVQPCTGNPDQRDAGTFSCCGKESLTECNETEHSLHVPQPYQSTVLLFIR